jgi:hypothetical protein
MDAFDFILTFRQYRTKILNALITASVVGGKRKWPPRMASGKMVFLV